MIPRVKLPFGFQERICTTQETTECVSGLVIVVAQTTFALNTCGNTTANKSLLEAAGISLSAILDLTGCLMEELSSSGVTKMICNGSHVMLVPPLTSALLHIQSGMLKVNIGKSGLKPVAATTNADKETETPTNTVPTSSGLQQMTVNHGLTVLLATLGMRTSSWMKKQRASKHSQSGTTTMTPPSSVSTPNSGVWAQTLASEEKEDQMTKPEDPTTLMTEIEKEETPMIEIETTPMTGIEMIPMTEIEDPTLMTLMIEEVVEMVATA